MRGISAKTLEEVLTAVDAIEGSPSDLGTELFGVVAAIDSAPALRRVLTDPSTESDAKAGLAGSVFGGKVGDDTLAVLKTAVSGRWAAGRDFTDGLETAGVAALVAAADSGGDLELLETELFEVGRTVVSDAELRGVVSDKSVPLVHKATLVTRVFGGKVSPVTLALAQQAAVGRSGSFEKVLTRFGETAAERRDRLVAVVRVAYDLGDEEKQRLTSALAAKYGHDVHLNILVDPAVVGGISVSVGGQVVDGTMSSRLEVARRRIAG